MAPSCSLDGMFESPSLRHPTLCLSLDPSLPDSVFAIRRHRSVPPALGQLTDSKDRTYVKGKRMLERNELKKDYILTRLRQRRRHAYNVAKRHSAHTARLRAAVLPRGLSKMACYSRDVRQNEAVAGSLVTHGLLCSC